MTLTNKSDAQLSLSTGESDAYESRLDAQIRKHLRHGPKAPIDIIRGCQGAFPSEVMRAARRLFPGVTEGQVTCFLLAQADQKLLQRESRLGRVEGNPVLCSWYFTSDGCDRIARVRSWTGRRLAFLGTPRLYEWFRDHQLGGERCLLDLDEVVTAEFAPLVGSNDQVIRYDVSNPLPTDLDYFDYVFFDPLSSHSSRN
jgi:hypothetical protein